MRHISVRIYMEVSVAGEMDREKLKEFRGQLRRRCIKSDVEKWEKIVL